MPAPALSEAQRKALDDAQKILETVGLSATGLQVLDTATERSQPRLDMSSDGNGINLPQEHVSLMPQLGYQAPMARLFSPAEKQDKKHHVNRQTKVTHIVDHPLEAVVEYPQTAGNSTDAIAHRYSVDGKPFVHPKGNIQYSLGDSHGGHDNVGCGLLLDGTGKPFKCRQLKTSCRGLKYCEFSNGEAEGNTGYVMMRPEILSQRAESSINCGAEEVVFMRTLGLYCALKERGCDVGENSQTSRPGGGLEHGSRSPRKRPAPCAGEFKLRVGKQGQRFLECEHRSSKNLDHLYISDLNDYDLGYLEALLTSNNAVISNYEITAQAKGYGPLVSCTFTASRSEQKELCPHWHRDSRGRLKRGLLKPQTKKCPSTFDIYTPYDLQACPFVVIICRHPHTHPPPRPTKTPDTIMGVFHALLMTLDWKLADTSPRKLALDSAFMQSFRKYLSWTKKLDPPLSQLHPSLGNFDHVRRCIGILRSEFFPKGTGLEGAKLLLEGQRAAPPEERYLRAVEVHTLSDSTQFTLIICMTPSMSRQLLNSQRVTIDTSFKRIHDYQEFEIETWDDANLRSVVSSRAFTTSQSGEAHFILFRRIFEIAQSDTGRGPCFRHIHGSGFDVWVADAHRGQALGLGMFCRSLCQGLTSPCHHEPHRQLRDLDAYDHLKRFYRICVVHFKRNIHELRTVTTSEVRAAMSSLASATPLPNYKETLSTIQRGGKKALAWLKDKESSKFVLPALYRPLSFIPLEIWKSAPSSTNGNEQAHRNINRDGVDMTLLAGIMRGMQYDARTAATLELYSGLGIHPRDQLPTPYRRAAASLYRKVKTDPDLLTFRQLNKALYADTYSVRTTSSQPEALGQEGGDNNTTWARFSIY
ncbi:hypothetical protein ONZ45_g15590 [Pleurotus djamor]|nr:hypothetical protein ONZ45_g15590 [Pleurotus djamor]